MKTRRLNLKTKMKRVRKVLSNRKRKTVKMEMRIMKARKMELVRETTMA